MIKQSARKRTVVLSLVGVLALAGAAYAYWTTTGSGSGSAGTGTSQTVTISQTATVSGLYPGGPAQGLDFKVSNPASGPQYVSAVTVAIASVTKATGAPAGTCDASDYTVTQPTTAVNQDLPTGDTSFSGAKAGTIKMVNKASAQDACKGATVNLSYTAS